MACLRHSMVRMVAASWLVASPALGQTASSAPGNSMQTLLGRGRGDVESRVGVHGTDESGGWVRYRATLLVRFERGRAVALVTRVPAGMSCEDAARWMGYPDAGPPLRHRDSCEWPGISDRHVLAPGHAGSLRLANGSFEIRLR